MIEETNWFLKALAYCGFSAVGGMTGFALRTISSKQKLNPWRCALEGLAAAFVGLLVLLMCEAMGLSAQWTGVIVGVCGWLGATATIVMLENVVRNKLGLGDKAAAPETPNASPPQSN